MQIAKVRICSLRWYLVGQGATVLTIQRDEAFAATEQQRLLPVMHNMSLQSTYK